MARIVVTGGAGYIGSHTMWALHARGHRVSALDDLSTGRSASIQSLQYLPFSFDSPSMHTVLSVADAIIHCAASTSAPESVDNPGKYYRNNVARFVELLDIAKAKGIPVVYASSAAVYGDVDSPKGVTEKQGMNPENPYGMTKLIGERMLKEWGLRHVSLRYFNLAGADPKMRTGPSRAAGTLFSAILKAARGDKMVTLYQAKEDTYDGFPVRDFIHPTDLADANVYAVEWLLRGGRSRTLNVGTGEGHSTLEVFKAFKKHVPELKYLAQNPREGDPFRSTADVTAIKRVLGWQASAYSKLECMVTTSLLWDQTLTTKPWVVQKNKG